ncbi:MAG TPA: carbonic anhydrase [Pyrinomonadaceae bacterium]|nr:carbonic anhydrase [Pyrinomonadaceae bacterium]
MKSKQDRIDFESYVSRQIAPEISKAAGVPLLMLQCMDSRYPHRVIQTMDAEGLRGKYDQLILAGASLGVIHKREWQITFLDQLGFAIKEHNVSQVLILDHRDCGAYKKFLDPPVTPDDPKKEKEAHIRICKQAIRVIRRKFPQLTKVRCLLLPIEAVEELATSP